MKELDQFDHKPPEEPMSPGAAIWAIVILTCATLAVCSGGPR